MLCPTCDNVKCRGICLDRGELDRLIERADNATHAPVPQAPAQHARAPERRDDPRHSGDRDAHAHGYRHKRPKSLLGELFDF